MIHVQARTTSIQDLRNSCPGGNLSWREYPDRIPKFGWRDFFAVVAEYGECLEGGACDELCPLREVVGAEGVGAVEVLFAAWAGDGEVADDELFACAAGVADFGAGGGDVLDDLGDFARAACAFPDVFGFLFDAVEAEADADGVDAAGLEDARDGGEVIEHGAIGGEVADGVDEVEGEAEARPRAAGGQGLMERLHACLKEAGLCFEWRGRVFACVGDHAGFEVKAGDAPPVGGGEAGEATCAAGRFEPMARAVPKAKPLVCLFQEF